MKTYTVYLDESAEDPLERARFMPEGFSFFAAIFQAFWAFYHRLWLAGVILLLVGALLTYLERTGYLTVLLSSIVNLAVLAFVGFEAYDWRRSQFDRQGYVFAGVVVAKDEEAAKQRFFDHYFARNRAFA